MYSAKTGLVCFKLYFAIKLLIFVFLIQNVHSCIERKFLLTSAFTFTYEITKEIRLSLHSVLKPQLIYYKKKVLAFLHTQKLASYHSNVNFPQLSCK